MTSNILDRILSRLLRYDLTKTDIVKWVQFSRNLLGMLFVAILSVAGLAAFLSTRQAKTLLERSLAAQGEALGRALARAAFVPLTLEDDEGLARLVATTRDAENLSRIRILDTKGKIWYSFERPGFDPSEPGIELSYPVQPLLERDQEARGEEKPIGRVEVRMSSASIQRQNRVIAVLNLGVGLVMAGVVLGAGFLVTRRLVQGMHSLVDEARLTEELKRANAELEAFSYSVSHDLRAPLRHVDGFSQALLEDYKDKLDGEARDYLARIRAGCQRMGRLIDDLLNLSRVIRHQIKTMPVDLSALASASLAQLQSLEPGRRVEAIVAPGLAVTGDPGLLAAALENLIGNAWKFTRKVEAARIEFGSENAEGEIRYFVKDNGAGFDMAYAGKLFTAFQRLHTDREFPGTGIGLATVHRIIGRHGGRIWAESSPGAGATFRFTIKS